MSKKADDYYDKKIDNGQVNTEDGKCTILICRG
jgi:hypothetical protein